jgi:hypothetical protein
MGRGTTRGGGINIPNLNEFRKALDPQVRKAALQGLLQRIPDLPTLSAERQESVQQLREAVKRFHGTKVPLTYFPGAVVRSPCADKFGYMMPASVRNATKLAFNLGTQQLLGQLGTAMGDPNAQAGPDSSVPAGFTYFGQFVDHDVTFDTSSVLDSPTNATAIHNMRSPSLELDSLYGRGPALDAYLYNFPTSGPPSAIRMQLGSNRQQRAPNQAAGPGGPAGSTGMVAQTDFDVPRVINPLDPNPFAPTLSTNTAIIGDPRNDENLIVSQFHHAMLKFHNAVVDSLVSVGMQADIFSEAKRIVTHHYQWAVVHDFLRRVCGQAAVSAALGSVNAPINSAFSMPVEFAVGAYRFGHSMIRNQYWLSGTQINASLKEVFDFVRNPNLPVMTNWVVDMNAFFETGIPVPVFNMAKKIDTLLAAGLSTLPGETGMMAALATRNLRRGLALGLPSGQGVAGHFGIPALTAAQLTQNLPAAQAGVLNASGGMLLNKTPLWYYCLRESAVLHAGEQLGPVGGRIVAETFVRMLKRDPNSYLNAAGGFTPVLPTLPSTPAGQFTVADIVHFAGVTMP